MVMYNLEWKEGSDGVLYNRETGEQSERMKR
jgi:hypothetical protein